jgi:hypothetical protein
LPPMSKNSAAVKHIPFLSAQDVGLIIFCIITIGFPHFGQSNYQIKCECLHILGDYLKNLTTWFDYKSSWVHVESAQSIWTLLEVQSFSRNYFTWEGCIYLDLSTYVW